MTLLNNPREVRFEDDRALLQATMRGKTGEAAVARLYMHLDGVERQLRASRAEIERLRSALQRIAYVDPPDETWDGSPSQALEWAGKIAREVLS